MLKENLWYRHEIDVIMNKSKANAQMARCWCAVCWGMDGTLGKPGCFRGVMGGMRLLSL